MELSVRARFQDSVSNSDDSRPQLITDTQSGLQGNAGLYHAACKPLL